MLSKEEMRMFDRFQYYDKHGCFPDKKTRLDATIDHADLQKLKRLSKEKSIPVSRLINEAIKKIIA